MDQRIVWEQIAPDWNIYRSQQRDEAVEFLRNKKGLVLDLGCANGRNFIKINGSIIGADFSKRMLTYARKNAKRNKINALFVNCDALHLPFRDNVFDSILFANTFHTVKWNRRKEALEEVRRVAKNSASVFISVWNRNQPRFRKAKRDSFIPWKSKGKVYQRYYYLYSKDELEGLMKNHFKNVRVFGSREKAFKRYPKNIIAIAKVSKKLGKS